MSVEVMKCVSMNALLSTLLRGHRENISLSTFVNRELI